MYSIDVHVLHLPTDNKVWTERCSASLATEPVNVIDLPGVVGDYWKSRCLGFHLGKAPYVSFVDPDDFVLPGAFEACQKELDADKDKNLVGVYTCDRQLDRDSPEVSAVSFTQPHVWSRELMESTFCVHQIVVMRREFVLQCIDTYLCNNTPNPVLEKVGGRGRYDQMFFKLLAMYGDFKNIPMYGYVWRQHRNQNHDSPATLKTRYQTPEQEAYTARVVHNILFNKKVSAD